MHATIPITEELRVEVFDNSSQIQSWNEDTERWQDELCPVYAEIVDRLARRLLSAQESRRWWIARAKRQQEIGLATIDSFMHSPRVGLLELLGLKRE